jgi:hypothetical protein
MQPVFIKASGPNHGRVGDGVSQASESASELLVGGCRQSHYSNPIFLRFR